MDTRFSDIPRDNGKRAWSSTKEKEEKKKKRIDVFAERDWKECWSTRSSKEKYCRVISLSARVRTVLFRTWFRGWPYSLSLVFSFLVQSEKYAWLSREVLGVVETKEEAVGNYINVPRIYRFYRVLFNLVLNQGNPTLTFCKRTFYYFTFSSK